MSRKKYGLTERRILKFIKEGRGMGTGVSYVPWFLVSDLSSQGRSHRVYWSRTNRVHHLFSDIEFLVFIHLIWADVEDVREQYPLPRPETVRIAKNLGIRHPVDPQSRTMWVMTTDFVVTVSTPHGSTLLAVAAKPEESLEKRSVLKKLEIERRYWEQRQVPWYLITDTHVKTRVGRNLLWIFDGSDNHSAAGAVELTIFSLLMEKRQTLPYVPIKIICRQIDHQLLFPGGTALSALRRLLAGKWITTDLSAMYIQDLPIAEFSFCEEPKHVQTLHFDR